MSSSSDRWRLLRVEFPQALRRIWLDVPGGLPLSRRAAEEGQRGYAELVTGARSHDDTADSARVCGRMAALLNVPPADVLPVPTIRHGLAMAAAALAPGTNVITMSGDRAIAEVFTQAGHRLRTVASQPDGSIALADIQAAIDAGAHAVATSTLLRDTGFRHDLPALAALCRSRGTWLMTDGSPSVGLFTEPPASWTPDVLVCGLAGGAGVVYRRPDLIAAAPALAQAPADVPAPGILALGGALDVLDDAGIGQVESRVHALTATLHHLLDAAGLPVRSPRGPQPRGNVTVVGADDPAALVAQLAAIGIDVAPCPRGLRVSVHACTLEEDLETFVSALDCLRRGEPPPMARQGPPGPLVCVDLNGVLDAYQGWRGADHWDPPRPGAAGFLRQLRDAGCRVTIFTTRHYRGVWRWLLQHGMAAVVDEVTDRKPAADVFVDDHAVCFRGDFDTLLADVLAFTPHWRRDG